MSKIDDCLRIFRAAAKREVSDAEIEAYLEALQAHKLYLRSKDAALTDGEAALQAARDLAGKIEATAIIAKRNAALNYVKRLEKVGWVMNVFGKNPALGLETLLAGSQRAKDGARMGVAQVQASLQKRYRSGFSVDLERTGYKALFSKGAMDREVMNALWLLDQEGDTAKAALSKLSEPAQAVARVIRKWQEVTRLEANEAGAWIAKRSDYIVRQSHDSERIRRAGIFEWAADAKKHFDIPTMMRDHGVVNEAAMLKATFDNVVSGNHAKDAPEDVTAFKGPGNLAKKLSQSRSILFKDADAFYAYNQKYGTGNLRESVLQGLESAGASTGLLKTLGTNPQAMFDAIRADVTAAVHGVDLGAEAAIQGKERDYRNYMAAIDGSMNRPMGEMLARRSANVRSVVAMARLGGMILSQLGDIPVYGSGARYQGRGFFSGMVEAVSGLGRSLKAADRRELAAATGVVLDNMAGELGRIGSFAEAGGMTNAMQTFMKWNLSQWWTNRMRTSAAFGMSHHLALQAGKDFSALHPDYQRVLSLYGIKEAEWNVIKQAGKRSVDGLDYLTPEEVAALPDDVIRQYAGPAASDRAIKKEREAIAEKLRVYFSDQTETLALEPDAKTKAILLQGSQPGTPLGELMRFVMQFKSFSGAYLQRVVGRELFGKGYEGDSILGALAHGNGELVGLAQLIVTTTIMGYASMALKDLAKGRTPRDPTQDPAQAAKVFAAALVQGGGAGIYGDFLFGEASRFGSGTVETLAGPTISSAGRIVDLYHKAIHGDDVKAAALNEAISDTPFLNLFYTRLALNYLILYRIQEGMNPGYLRRMERRAQDENAQTYLIPPSSVVK